MRSGRAKGRKDPQWYLDEPDIDPIDMFYITAFYRLDTCRPPDGGIPWDRIVMYGERAGLSEDMVDVLVTVIYAMDVPYQKWRAEEARKQQKHKA